MCIVELLVMTIIHICVYIETSFYIETKGTNNVLYQNDNFQEVDSS